MFDLWQITGSAECGAGVVDEMQIELTAEIIFRAVLKQCAQLLMHTFVAFPRICFVRCGDAAGVAVVLVKPLALKIKERSGAVSCTRAE